MFPYSNGPTLWDKVHIGKFSCIFRQAWRNHFADFWPLPSGLIYISKIIWSYFFPGILEMHDVCIVVCTKKAQLFPWNDLGYKLDYLHPFNFTKGHKESHEDSSVALRI